MFAPRFRRLLTAAALGTLLAAPLQIAAQTVSVSKSSDALPSEIAAPINALLAPAGVRVVLGAVTVDFWWVTSLPLTEGAGVSWSRVAEGTLVGAVRVSAPWRDIRGRVVKPGVYTLRYGVQPANGDHLGVSPHREFLLLSPVASDTTVTVAGHDAAVDLSKATIGGSHPAVLSLDPPVATAPPLSAFKTDAGFDAVVFEVPAAGEVLRFGLILIGRIEV